MTIPEFFHKIFWTIPFFFFLAGYFVLNHFYAPQALITPTLLGKTVQEALPVLKEYQLNTRLLAEKEDSELKEGTIVNQIPAPGQMIRPYQTIFIAVSKKASTQTAPLLHAKTEKEIDLILKTNGIRFKTVGIEASAPQGTCIAQIPAPGELISEQGMTVYCALDTQKKHLFPDLVGIDSTDATKFLENYGMETLIFHAYPVSDDHECTHCTVIEQRPLAGTFISTKTPLTVHLKIAS